MHRRSRILALAALVSALGVMASLSPIGLGLEERVGLGLLLRWRGPQAPPPELLIVRFDDNALLRLRSVASEPVERWPQPLQGCQKAWGGLEGLTGAVALDRLPRTLHACLVQLLTRRGAAVVAFDIVFRPDRERDRWIEPLAEAIRRHERVVLLEDSVRDLPGILVERRLRPHPALSAAALATAPFRLPKTTDPIHQFWAYTPATAREPQLPTKAIEAFALPALSRFAHQVGEDLLPGPAATRLASGMAVLRPRLERLDAILSAPGQPIWPDTELAALRTLARLQDGPDAYYLNPYGPPGTFPSVSAADLLLEEFRPGASSLSDLRGRVVFVGWQEMARVSADDRFETAFSTPGGVDMHGIEIAATAFANLLHDHTIKALPEWVRLALVALFGFVVMLASCRGMPGRGLAAVLAVMAVYTLAAGVCFLVGRVWLPLVVPLLGLMPLSLGLAQLERYRKVAKTLTIYTPRTIGQRLLKGDDTITAQAQHQEVTVLITDIAGFTTLAERTAPDALADFVNRHFTTLTACVEAEDGTVAQFIGDSMLAFWGAPDPQFDHAIRACRAALAIATALEVENRHRAAGGQPPIAMRMGIHTGEVTAGNVGAPERGQYGIVGDTVNSTQRIEQLGKKLGQPGAATTILVSARTREKAATDFRFVDVGVHDLRGRRETAQIYQLVSMLPASQPELQGSEMPINTNNLALPTGLANPHA